MTKVEMVAYLNGLIGIMRDKEDGARPVGDTLAWEYLRVYQQLREQLGKEKEDEARKSKSGRVRESQEGAHLKGDEPRRGIADRRGDGESSVV